MKKNYIVILFSLLIVVLVGAFIIFKNTNKEEVKTEETEKVYYYTYEGKFVMSSTAHKVTDYKELKNNFFVKEKVKKVKSDSKIMEVIYDEFGEDPIVYGYYTEEEFSKYFKDKIDEGFTCDSDIGFNMGEGVILRCIFHDSGYSYEKVESELCANVNNNLVCIKPNDWENIDKYREEFENAGDKCEYYDYSTGKYSDSKKPKLGNLECSNEKPSIRKDNTFYCLLGSDGGSICSVNTGWCSIGEDLNTYCFGID